MTEFKVVFSYNGFDLTACFISSFEMDAFASMMAEEGRLLRVWVCGKDHTSKYVTITEC